MIEDIPTDKIIQTAMRHGADFAEVFVERTRQTSISCDNHRIEQAQTFFDVGVGIRVFCNGCTAYGSTNDLSKRSLLVLARTVGKALREKGAKPKPITLYEKNAKQVACICKHPFGIPLEEKCGIVQRANDVAWQMDKTIQQVSISYRDVVRRIWVASSEGTFAADEQVGTTFSAHIIASDDICLQTGQEPIGGAMGFEIFDDCPPEEVVEKAARRAVKMLAARPAPAGRMPVVLSSEAGGTMIHEAVGHGLEADIFDEGLSVYSGRLGERVASELITVVDDATLKGRRGSYTFDDEGTPAQRTVLIERGVLRNYLTDKITSKKNGGRPTGNGRRQNYHYPPTVRMTNTLILPGNDNPTAILRGTCSGLFVRRMGGGQVNTINGDFVFEVQEGYLIEGGNLGEPVRGATLIGNGPRILESIDRVGKDLGFSIGTCGKNGQEAPVACGQPTIRIPEIVIGGIA